MASVIASYLTQMFDRNPSLFPSFHHLLDNVEIAKFYNKIQFYFCISIYENYNIFPSFNHVALSQAFIFEVHRFKKCNFYTN